jgi:hypothetical protein
MPLHLPPPDPAFALRQARAKLTMLRHVRDELALVDPRTLNGREDADLVRDAIEVYLTLLDVEITDVRRIVTGLLAELERMARNGGQVAP